MKNELKILIINYEHPPLGGGGGVCSKVLAEELVKKGHTVHILTTKQKGDPAIREENGVTIFRVPVLGKRGLKAATPLTLLSFPLFAIPKGLSLCRKNKYDLIHSHFYAPSGTAGLFVSILSRIPNVLYIHGGDVYDPSRPNNTPAGKGLLSWALRQNAKWQNKSAKMVMCQSSDTRNNIQQYTGYTKEVQIVPLPFEPPQHPQRTRLEMNMKEEIFYLITAGRIIQRKGYTYLISACKHLDANIHLQIIGDGPELENLKKQAQDDGVADRVHFLGYVESEEEKYTYFALSDLYVLSSLHEGMGIVLQEAMEFGLPIVATNHGGQVDLVSDHVNGILVKPKDPKALAKAIQKLYEDKALRERFSAYNSKKIEQYYAPKIADLFLDKVLPLKKNA